MTDHDEAVQIAEAAFPDDFLFPCDLAERVVAALARAGLLARPGELAALRAVAEAANRAYVKPELYERALGVALRALAALDAAPAAEIERLRGKVAELKARPWVEAPDAVITEGPLPHRFAVECKPCGTRVGGRSELEVGMWKLGHDTAARRHNAAELDAARATIAEQAAEVNRLRAVVRSLHYRMTCCDPEPTRDEIVDTLARVLDAALATETTSGETSVLRHVFADDALTVGLCGTPSRYPQDETLQWCPVCMERQRVNFGLEAPLR